MSRHEFREKVQTEHDINVTTQIFRRHLPPSASIPKVEQTMDGCLTAEISNPHFQLVDDLKHANFQLRQIDNTGTYVCKRPITHIFSYGGWSYPLIYLAIVGTIVTILVYVSQISKK